MTDTRLLESMAGLKDALALEVERFDREVRWNAAQGSSEQAARFIPSAETGCGHTWRPTRLTARTRSCGTSRKRCTRRRSSSAGKLQRGPGASANRAPVRSTLLSAAPSACKRGRSSLPRGPCVQAASRSDRHHEREHRPAGRPRESRVACLTTAFPTLACVLTA